MDAKLSAERPDGVASKRTSTARTPAGVVDCCNPACQYTWEQENVT